MAGTTPKYGFRYPSASDPDNVPGDIQNLAEDVEGAVVAKSDVTTASTATSQTTASASYTDLATVGPVVTVTIGPSGRALVIVGCNMFNGTAGGICGMAFGVSGATIRAVNNDESFQSTSSTVDAQAEATAVSVVTGLTPGNNTFTAKYYASGGTGTFRRRRITVIPL